MRYFIASSQSASLYQEPGASQPYRVIRLVDECGRPAEIRVCADLGEPVDVLTEQLLQLLSATFESE